LSAFWGKSWYPWKAKAKTANPLFASRAALNSNGAPLNTLVSKIPGNDPLPEKLENQN